MRYLLFFTLILLLQSCGSYPMLKTYKEPLTAVDSKGKLQFSDGSSARMVPDKKTPVTTLFLVRHAEKAKGGNDPHLTEQGSRRAVKLADILEAYGIEKIYSSNYQRTLETAEPLLKRNNLVVEIYNPRNLEELKQNILTKDIGKKILVVGHSNSTPSLANLFSGENRLQSFDESDYENLLLIEFRDPKKVIVTQLKLVL